MPLSFSFVGLLNIFLLFWGDLRKWNTKLYFLALILLQISFFVPPIDATNVSINITMLFGLVLALVGAGIKMDTKQLFNCLVWSLIVAVTYVCANSVGQDFMIYFDPKYLFFALAIVTIFIDGLHKKLFFSLLCIILCELGVFGLINGDFLFYPMFAPDCLDCLIPLVYVCIIENALVALVKKRKLAKNKTNIV